MVTPKIQSVDTEVLQSTKLGLQSELMTFFHPVTPVHGDQSRGLVARNHGYGPIYCREGPLVFKSNPGKKYHLVKTAAGITVTV